MKRILLTIWQLPQIIIAYLLVLFFKVTGRMYYRYVTPDGMVRVWNVKMKGAMSLGNSIFLGEAYRMHKETFFHEFGHCLQSRILGPLYLLVIGIPSLLWASHYTVFRPKRSYYSFYTERWANKLSGNE